MLASAMAQFVPQVCMCKSGVQITCLFILYILVGTLFRNTTGARKLFCLMYVKLKSTKLQTDSVKQRVKMVIIVVQGCDLNSSVRGRVSSSR